MMISIVLELCFSGYYFGTTAHVQCCSGHDLVQFPIHHTRWWKKENEFHLLCGRPLNVFVFFALSLGKA